MERKWVAAGLACAVGCQVAVAGAGDFGDPLAIVGPTGEALTPPDVEVGGWFDGDVLVIQAVATDDDGIDRVELYLDGQLVGVRFAEPYETEVEGVAEGDHALQARAYDRLGAMASDTIYVILGIPCGATNECEATDVCVSGRCVAGPDQPGGLGAPCDIGDNCVSRLCGNDSSGTQVCTEPCDPGPDGCPGGFECVTGPDEASGVCWPTAGASGCGCRVGARDDATGHGVLALVLALTVLAFRRRRSPLV